MQKRWTLVLFLTMLACAASAQIPTKGNVFFGYSYNRAEIVSNDATNLNGWDASLEGKFLPWVGIVGDFGGTYGHNITEHNFFFGPRVSVEVNRYRPFAELMIGASHISLGKGGSSDTSFGNAVGGGLDYRVAGPVAVRGQLDWIHIAFSATVRMTYGFPRESWCTSEARTVLLAARARCPRDCRRGRRRY